MISRFHAEVIGDPVEHSLSPLLHRHLLERYGIEGSYRATRVKADELSAFLDRRAKDPDWRGCNLTMPLKQLAFAYLDDVEHEAKRIGALNIVYREDGRLVGGNTDSPAVRQLLEAQKIRPAAKAAIVGSGGAARAALDALCQLGVSQVSIISRSVQAASSLLETFGLEGEIVPLGVTPPADLLINASPLGMKGHSQLPVDPRQLAPDSVVFDMVYSPLRTGLLQSAQALGLETIDGIDMLIRQAALSFTHFFRTVPDPAGFGPLKARLTS